MSDDLSRVRAAFSGRYEIERELGSGGMATVYLASDVKHDRKVAVKILRPELAAALGPDRFPREIRIVAQLQHPHVLPLHDSGEVEGFLFYVMPFVNGESRRARRAGSPRARSGSTTITLAGPPTAAGSWSQIMSSSTTPMICTS